MAAPEQSVDLLTELLSGLTRVLSSVCPISDKDTVCSVSDKGNVSPVSDKATESECWCEWGSDEPDPAILLAVLPSVTECKDARVAAAADGGLCSVEGIKCWSS